MKGFMFLAVIVVLLFPMLSLSAEPEKIPAPKSVEAGSSADAKIRASFAKCAEVCKACMEHCEAKGHTRSKAACHDCWLMCQTASQIDNRAGTLAPIARRAAVEACRRCAAECEKMPEDHHMAKCAAECRRCAGDPSGGGGVSPCPDCPAVSSETVIVGRFGGFRNRPHRIRNWIREHRPHLFGRRGRCR